MTNPSESAPVAAVVGAPLSPTGRTTDQPDRTTPEGVARVDAAALAAAVAEMCVAATRDLEVDDLLRALCDIAARLLDVHGAGVMGMTETRTRAVRATTDAVAGMEALQQALQEGPCRDAIDTDSVVVANDPGEMAWPDFKHLALRNGIRAVVAVPLVSRGRSWGSLDLYQTRDHRWRPDEIDAARLLADVAVSHVVMASDRDAVRDAQAMLAHRALHDDLTGLPNRALMYELIGRATAAVERRRGWVAVLFIDLDRLKPVNDRHGHQFGDQLLREVARRMTGAVRTGDAVARLAGDEFLVLCEGDDGADPLTAQVVAVKVARRILAAIAQPIRIDGETVTLTASVGVATTWTAAPTIDLVHEADLAMYAAKTAGGHQTSSRTYPPHAASAEQRTLERDIPHALNRRELRVHYQPIVDVDGTTPAVEALIRWQHPTLGLITAARFVDLATSVGVIEQIAGWTVQQACHDMAAWQRELGVHAPEVVFCNVGPAEILSATFAAALRRGISRNNLTPRHVGLEILESDFAHETVAAALTDFHNQGHPLSLDDFGTGYSSLSRLIQLPLAYAKLDRSFVTGLPHDQRSRDMTAAVLTVANNLNLTVIAEGIETPAQARYLTEQRCPLLQGFLYATPQPAAAITAAIEGHHNTTNHGVTGIRFTENGSVDGGGTARP